MGTGLHGVCRGEQPYFVQRSCISQKENRLENAQRMYALIFDLDGVGLAELRNLFLRFGGDPERVRRLPMPTFLVLSGDRAAYLLCFPAAD